MSAAAMHPSEDSSREAGQLHLAQSPAELAHVRRQGIALSWWRRELSPSVASFMAPQNILMPVQRLFRLRHHEAMEPALDAQLDRFLDQRWHGFDAWRQDLLGLLALARSLSRGDELRVRLESVCSNGCRLFHSDLVALRMITTYRGPGTEWLPASAVDAHAASRLENRHVLDPSAVRRLGTGDIALMKGDRYPGHVGHGLMHRSPPAAPGRPRVVLAVDLD